MVSHRESPIGLAEIDAMRQATLCGAIITPLSPGLYLGPRTIADLVDFMAGRILDLLGIRHDLAIRWEQALADRKAGTEPKT